MVFFHIIDNLKRGGAETLLYHVVKNLGAHQHVVVPLTTELGFSAEETRGMQIIPLGFTSMTSLPAAAWKLKRLIKKHKPDLVHAHLPLASLVARLATPKKIKLFISVHNTYSESLRKVSPRLFWLEKKLHSSRDRLLFVSSAIRHDYQQIIGIKGSSFVLYNFIADKFFDPHHQRTPIPRRGGPLRLVSVGSLKKQKNFDTLIKAFASLDPAGFTLDIFGDGPEREALLTQMADSGFQHVQLRGAVADMETQLKNFDAFILASRYEGFGIAPLEAAATGLPLLLSGIDVFREVTKDHARYFSPADESNIADTIKDVANHYDDALAVAAQFRPMVQRAYSLQSYLQQLLNIYNHE